MLRPSTALSRRRVLGLLAAAPGLPAVLSGCGRDGSRGDRPADTLTVATADNISSLDPALAYDTWSTAAVHAVTRRLVDYDIEAKLVPELAERWEVSADGKRYTFRLRAGERFADGAA